jgi:hypothetical protein
LGGDPVEWGRHLFALLREFDAHDVNLVERPAEAGDWEAIHFRLRRAAERH